MCVCVLCRECVGDKAGHLWSLPLLAFFPFILFVFAFVFGIKVRARQIMQLYKWQALWLISQHKGGQTVARNGAAMLSSMRNIQVSATAACNQHSLPLGTFNTFLSGMQQLCKYAYVCMCVFVGKLNSIKVLIYNI